MATTLHHTTQHVALPTTAEPCGSALVGDWDTVTCSGCGLQVNTLDVRPSSEGHVLRLTDNGVLVEVPWR